MEIRTVQNADERLQVARLCSIAFLYPIDIEKEKQNFAENPDDPGFQNTWACFDECGRVTSAMTNHPLQMYYDGHTVGMGGIGGVVSAPEARRRGSIRAIFQKVFEDDLAKGRLFSTLYPFSHAYYRKFGYESCNEARLVTFPSEALKKYRMQADVRMYMPGEDDQGFRSVYHQYASGYTYAAARDDYGWKRVLSGDPFKDVSHRYILSRNGIDTAYCMYRPQRNADNTLTMVVSDYAYTGPEALHDLLGFFYMLSAQFSTILLELPDGFEISALLDEPYDVKHHAYSRTMARVLDVGRALKLMRHPHGHGAYMIQVNDDFLPANTGTYHVTYAQGGNVTVKKTADTACDLSVSVQTFAQLCFGHLSLAMACNKEDVTLYGNKDVLEQVFVRKAKFLVDRF